MHSHHVVHSQAPALTAKALHEMPPVFAISLSTDRLVQWCLDLVDLVRRRKKVDRDSPLNRIIPMV